MVALAPEHRGVATCADLLYVRRCGPLLLVRALFALVVLDVDFHVVVLVLGHGEDTLRTDTGREPRAFQRSL